MISDLPTPDEFTQYANAKQVVRDSIKSKKEERQSAQWKAKGFDMLDMSVSMIFDNCLDDSAIMKETNDNLKQIHTSIDNLARILDKATKKFKNDVSSGLK